MLNFEAAKSAKEAAAWQRLQDAVDELATELHRCRTALDLYPDKIVGLPIPNGVTVTGSGANAVAPRSLSPPPGSGHVRRPTNHPGM